MSQQEGSKQEPHVMLWLGTWPFMDSSNSGAETFRGYAAMVLSGFWNTMMYSVFRIDNPPRLNAIMK